MNWRRMGLQAMAAGATLAMGLACNEKVPLHPNPGTFDVLAAHYFENENTQYIFFAISGLKADQAREAWPRRLELKADGLANGAPFAPAGDGYVVLDFARGVHRHQWVSCGEGRICGSMSIKSDQPLTGMQIRLRYHQDSAMALESSVPNSVHPADGTASAQSALVYGVFSRGNQVMQVRVHNNFGTPGDEDFPSFGMSRDFAIDQVRLAAVTMAEQGEIYQTTGSPLLFPAAPCASRELADAKNRVQKLSKKSDWWIEAFDPKDNRNAACFRARLVDQAGQELASGPGIARRNPELQSEAVLIPTPLKTVYKIPLVLSYCRDPQIPEVASEPFLQYQKYILGIPEENGVDLCFSSSGGQDAIFGKLLDAKLAAKLSAARETIRDSTNPRQDLFFAVAINENVVGSQYFHKQIMERLGELIRTERETRASPRLVGAFVYDSDTLESKGLSLPAAIQSTMIWCPRKSATKGVETDGNCVGYVGGKLDLGPVVFKVPMGPFPTMKSFLSSFASDVNSLLVRDPRLEVRAFSTNENTAHIPQGTATFFDGQRVSLKPGEGLRYCGNRDPIQLGDSLAVRMQDPESGVVRDGTLGEASRHLLGGEKVLNVNFGMIWRYPFVGGVSYKAPLEGKIFSFIPVSASYTASDPFGDQKLTKPKWDVGALLQKCTRFCDHPMFDEAGVYQAGVSWRSGAAVNACLEPHLPEPPAVGVLP